MRQGCLASSLIFAVVADVLLRILAQRPADGVTLFRAFAEDTALILNSAPDLEATFRIFYEYATYLNFTAKRNEKRS